MGNFRGFRTGKEEPEAGAPQLGLWAGASRDGLCARARLSTHPANTLSLPGRRRLAFVLQALPAWNTAQEKFPNREVYGLRVPGEGWAQALRTAAGGGGAFSKWGWGRAAAPAVRGVSPGSQRCRQLPVRAGGPRDRSPVCGLGGERPKEGGERQGRRGLLAALA